MDRSCVLADCIWSDQATFCATLKQASVPLDHKWPLMVLYLRGIRENTVFSEKQKAELQELMLDTLQKKNFSETAFVEVEKTVHAIITANYTEKIREITKEAAELAKDVHSMLGERHNDVAGIVTAVDSNLAKGIEPDLVLADLRTSLKSVLAKMTQDVDTLMTLSRQDGLTGLANRRSFDEFLQKAVASWEDDGIPISLIMLDIDYFKKVNDTFGHRTGDQVLQALAKQVTKIIHPLITNDDKALVARYGGEEFGIVLCGSLAPRAVVLAEVIRKTASKIVVIPPEEESGDDKEKLALTVSLGVATVCVWEGWKGAYQSNIVDFADKALYQAKSGGRNCTVQYLPESDEPYKVVPSN